MLQLINNFCLFVQLNSKLTPFLVNIKGSYVIISCMNQYAPLQFKNWLREVSTRSHRFLLFSCDCSDSTTYCYIINCKFWTYTMLCNISVCLCFYFNARNYIQLNFWWQVLSAAFIPWLDPRTQLESELDLWHSLFLCKSINWEKLVLHTFLILLDLNSLWLLFDIYSIKCRSVMKV